MDAIKVSVVVPVYGVAAFIERCARSLFSQTFGSVEFIFVDDASPDESMEILQRVCTDFPDREIVTVRHDRNKGLPAARNTGMKHARGEYIFHCDSDDYVEADMLESLYAEAERENADAVWCDWFLSMSRSERLMKEPCFQSVQDSVKAMLSGGMKFNVWNKLVRRNLYVDNGISFPEGRAMGEDLTMVKLFAAARKVGYCPKAFYHYVKTNSNAYSRNYSDDHLAQLKSNVEELTEWLETRYIGEYSQSLQFLKLEVKFPFLLMDDRKRFYAKWTAWFPEANAYISQNTYISSRSRMIQMCAAQGRFTLVTIYSLLLNKLVYGLIYR